MLLLLAGEGAWLTNPKKVGTPEVLIRLGYDIGFYVPVPVTIVGMLHVHPSLSMNLREPDEVRVTPTTPLKSYIDYFGNRCTRFVAPQGEVRLNCSTLIQNSGELDPYEPHASQYPVEELPDETLTYLLNSRYCEVDRLSSVAVELFGNVTPGWGRVQAICDWVNSRVTFGYQHARSTKTALDVFTERVGVCRDFQHLAVTFCRALNIPARYATGYLGDIGIPPSPSPMDFSAWFQVYLEGGWWTFDARHNHPRIGRILMAVGRDASDVAITTSFGIANLRHFAVTCEEETPLATPAGEPAAFAESTTILR
jgi:transglutaminase-like putative cysteine protease